MHIKEKKSQRRTNGMWTLKKTIVCGDKSKFKEIDDLIEGLVFFGASSKVSMKLLFKNRFGDCLVSFFA